MNLSDKVEERTGLSTREIYDIHGEVFYRCQEFQALHEIVENTNSKAVVGISGGAVTHSEIFSLIHACTLPVWLKARPEDLFIRNLAEDSRWTSADRHDALEALRDVYKAREPYFEKSRIVIDTTAKTPEICARQLTREIKAVS